MEEDLDDFGDLYADVEVHVSAGIRNRDELCTEGVNKSNTDSNSNSNSYDSDELLLNSNCVKKVVEEDLNSDSDGFANRGCETNNDDNEVVDDGSESEDDLRIVLNDDDDDDDAEDDGGRGYGGFLVSRVVRIGDKVVRTDGGDDDGNDGLVIVTESDHRNDGLEKSPGCTTGDRGNATKSVYASQHSLFKYVRPHSAAFLRNSKVCRTDLDVDGSDQHTMSCSGFDALNRNLAISSKGFYFHLPRNRTIFDINIEAFEWKPWRHPSVDITDFFNFGMDEESWKSYCNSLAQFWRQRNMLTKIPVHGHGSVRANQACEAEFPQKPVVADSASCKIGLPKPRDRASTVLDSFSGDATSKEMNVRAIQIEDGTGERRPSIDVRRPRHLDSDVVIQIPTQESMETSYVSNEEEADNVHESLGNKCESGACQMRDSLSMHQTGCFPGDAVECLQKVTEPVFREGGEQKDTSDGMKMENLSRVGMDLLEPDSASHNQILHDLSLTSKDHSEMLKSVTSVEMEKSNNFTRRTSSRSITSSKHHQSGGSRSDRGRREPKDRKDSSQNRSSSQDEQNSPSRRRFCRVAEMEFSMDRKNYTCADRKGCYDAEHLRQGSRKHEQLYLNPDENGSFRKKCYYREEEVTVSYSSRRTEEKQEKENSYFDSVHWRSEQNLQEISDPFVRGDWDERVYFDERIIIGDGELKQRGGRFHERGYCKESKFCNTSISLDKERHLLRRNENDPQFRRGMEDYDYVLENRYGEDFINDKYGSTEDDCPHEMYRRQVSRLERENVWSDNIHRDAGSPCFGLGGSWREIEYDGVISSPDNKPISSWTCRELRVKDGRGWDEPSPPRNHAFDLWRSEGRLKNHWMRDENFSDCLRMPDLVEKKGGYFSLEGKEHHYQSCRSRRDIYFDEESCYSDETPLYVRYDIFDERKRYRCQFDCEKSFEHKDLDGSYNPDASPFSERSSGHEHGCIDGDLAYNRKPLNNFRYGTSRKRIVVKKSVDSEACRHIRSASHIANRGRHGWSEALRCREPLSLSGQGVKHRRSSEAEVRSSRYGKKAHFDNENPKSLRHSNGVISRKAAPVSTSVVDSNSPNGISSRFERMDYSSSEHSINISNEKSRHNFPVVENQDDLGLEEGELPLEPEKQVGSRLNERVFEKTVSSLTIEARRSKIAEKKLQSMDAADGNKLVGVYDKNKILEMMAKMERRRERFKEPIASKKEPETSIQLQTNVGVQTAETKQQRPARKRRWGENLGP